MTDAGGVSAAPLLVASVTTAPPIGAGQVRLIVIVTVLPPLTLAGVMTFEAKTDALTVSTVDLTAPAYVAEIVTGVSTATSRVWIENVALNLPASTVTVGGGIAIAGLLLVS